MQPSETTVTSGLAEALDSDTDSESDNMSAQSEIDEAVQFSESSGTSSSDESQLESDVESSRAGTQTPKVKESEDMRKVKHVASFFFCLFLLWVCLNYVSMSAASLLLPVFPGLICALMPSGAQPLLKAVQIVFPTSLHLLKKFIGVDVAKSSFTRYVVCPKCCCLYKVEDCFSVENGAIKLKCCGEIPFPNHRQQLYTEKCNSPLVDVKKHKNGTTKVVPKLCYPYKSLVNSIRQFLSRENIKHSLLKWKERNIPEEVLADVYDGTVWKEFVSKGFFAGATDLAFMLNVDWFQPFTHTTDSLGAIYLTVLNLPCSERYKRENLILLSLLPVMEKEQSDLGPFLAPLVEE
jgi:hypothetical protein